MANRRGEVFLTALGTDAERLHPEILRQMRAVATDDDRAEGVFTVAGSRFRRLGALAVPVVGRRMLVTRFGRGIPFTLSTSSGRTADGLVTLDTIREFRFPGAVQLIADRLTETALPGIVRNVLGERGRVELLEECSVTPRGFLRMRTRRVALPIGRRRIVLRGPLRVAVDLEDGWDEGAGRRTIAMRARNPVLGTVLVYRGWYRYVDAPSVGQ